MFNVNFLWQTYAAVQPEVKAENSPTHRYGPIISFNVYGPLNQGQVGSGTDCLGTPGESMDNTSLIRLPLPR